MQKKAFLMRIAHRLKASPDLESIARARAVLEVSSKLDEFLFPFPFHLSLHCTGVLIMGGWVKILKSFLEQHDIKRLQLVQFEYPIGPHLNSSPTSSLRSPSCPVALSLPSDSSEDGAR